MTKIQESGDRVIANVERVIVGKHHEVQLALVALLCRGHLLIEDVPGTGKTVLAKAIAKSLGSSFRRIQFTPDLLPSDVTGLSIYNQKTQEFEFRPGPIMSQVVLADEINRATPKTQSALLECMEERQATIDGISHQMPDPFLVIATQNPIEYEGTFALPEAQLDRFMFELHVEYPSAEEEEQIVEWTTGEAVTALKPVLTGDELLELMGLVRRVPAPKVVVQAAVTLARMTRPTDALAPEGVREYVAWGAGPRASQFLVLGAKARAAMDGRPMADLEDLDAVVLSVLRHRIVVNFHAEAAGKKADDIVREVTEAARRA